MGMANYGSLRNEKACVYAFSYAHLKILFWISKELPTKVKEIDRA